MTLKRLLAAFVTVIVLCSQFGLSTNVYGESKITRPVELPISDRPPINQDVVEVSTPIQLLYVSYYQESYRDKSIKLMNSINMSNLPWIPIDQFAGTFDGNYYDISNLIIHQPSDDSSEYWGMFARTESSAVIKNMTLTNFTVDGAAMSIGTLVGNNGGKIEYVGLIGGKVERVRLKDPANSFLGGLVGWNDYSGWIENVYSTSRVSSLISPSGYVGGIAGGSHTAELNNIFQTYVAGVVASEDHKTRGLVGLGFTKSSYYDREITGVSGFSFDALSTLDMLNLDRFGWGDTWSNLPGKTYPFLKQIHSVSPEVLSPAIQNSAYSQKLQIPMFTGIPGDLIWQATSLPPGLSLSNDGTISGTPTSLGDQSFTVVVYSPSTHIVYGSGTVSLLINTDPQSSALDVNQIEVLNNLAPLADSVTVRALNAGDMFKVYDSPTGGNLIGQSSTVASGQTSAAISVAQLGAGAGQVFVSITNAGKLESARTSKSYDAEPIIPPPFTNDHISGLTVDQGTLSPTFSPFNFNYTVDVPSSVSSLNLSITKTDPQDTIAVPGATLTSVTGRVYAYRADLSVGSSLVQVAVIAPDGTTANAYLLTIHRASSNADLNGLSLSSAVLIPAFAPGITTYDSSVANGVTSLTVTANAADSASTLKVNGTTVISGKASGPIDLSLGNNMISIEVTAPDGTKKTYHLSLNRARPAQAPTPVLSANANLKMLQLSGIPLDFTAGTTNYTIMVGNSVSSVTLSAAAEHAKATVKMNSEAATTKQIRLNEGSNSVLVEVTAEDGITKKTYSLTITRAAAQIATANKPIQINTDPVAITVPASVTDAAIQVPTVTSGGTKQSTLPLVEIKFSTALGDVTVLIPDGTHITAQSSWDGVMKLPRVLNNGSVTIHNGNVHSVIEWGSTDMPLTFDKAVRIVLPNQAGKSAGYERDGMFKEITTTISADTQLAADQEIAAGGDAKMDVGSDLVIWTKHFGKFVSYLPVPPSTVGELSDVTGHWAENNIRELIRLGAVSGYSDGTYRPDNPITRAEFVSIIVRAFHLEGQDGKVFADTSDHWAKNAIAAAASRGVIVGYSHSNFGPDDFLTREQMAVIIVGAAQLASSADGKWFEDSASISEWAKSALVTATSTGLIGGYRDGTLKPKRITTRAEAVAVIYRALALKK